MAWQSNASVIVAIVIVVRVARVARVALHRQGGLLIAGPLSIRLLDFDAYEVQGAEKRVIDRYVHFQECTLVALIIFEFRDTTIV